MSTNTEIMRANLNHLLGVIKDKLLIYQLTSYENECRALEKTIHASVSSFQFLFEKQDKKNLIKSIMRMMDKIDKDIGGVETEMRGVFNYSDYESKRVGEAALKQEIKDVLLAMLKLVASTRLEKPAASPRP